MGMETRYKADLEDALASRRWAASLAHTGLVLGTQAAPGPSLILDPTFQAMSTAMGDLDPASWTRTDSSLPWIVLSLNHNDDDDDDDDDDDMKLEMENVTTSPDANPPGDTCVEGVEEVQRANLLLKDRGSLSPLSTHTSSLFPRCASVPLSSSSSRDEVNRELYCGWPTSGCVYHPDGSVSTVPPVLQKSLPEEERTRGFPSAVFDWADTSFGRSGFPTHAHGSGVAPPRMRLHIHVNDTHVSHQADKSVMGVRRQRPLLSVSVSESCTSPHPYHIDSGNPSRVFPTTYCDPSRSTPTPNPPGSVPSRTVESGAQYGDQRLPE